MATNAYTGKTAFETFQTLNYGDRIWPDVELSNWQKVENRFLSMSLDNFLISHGTFAYVVNPLDATDVHVTLSPNGLDSSFAGSINGCYFRINTVMTWEMSITVDGTYYLYLKEVTGQTDPTSDLSLDKEYKQTEYTGSDLKTRILMAIVTRTGGVLQAIDHDPAAQLTSQAFYDHIYSTSDPHGPTLTQTNLVVTNSTAGTAWVTNMRATNVTASSITATNLNVTGALTAAAAQITSLTATNINVANLTGTAASLLGFYSTTAGFNSVTANSISATSLTATTSQIGDLNADSIVVSSITGTTGFFNSLTSPTASVNSLSIGTNPIYKEFYYEQAYGPTSATEVNLNTLVGITVGDAQPLFIGASVLSPIQTGLYFKYSGLSDETNRYVVYNDNTVSVTGKMFIKFHVV